MQMRITPSSVVGMGLAWWEEWVLNLLQAIGASVNAKEQACM